MVNSWPGGFQAGVTVQAGGSALSAWTVAMSLFSGVNVQSLWNGTASANSGSVTVRNAPYNGTVAAGASTSFGFVASGSSGSGATVSCTAG